MELIKIKVLNADINAKGQKKIDDYENDEYEVPRDSNGNTIEFYIENNLNIPEELKEADKKKNLELSDDDYDYFYEDGYFRKEDFRAVVDDSKGGSVVYTDDMTFRVIETARQIVNKLK